MQRTLGWICKIAIALALPVSAVHAEDITVFAASSLRDAVGEIARAYEVETETTATLVFAASSSVARQVAQGAPADVLLLADRDWADWVVNEGAVDAMAPFAANRLVLIATGGEPVADLTGLSDALGDSYLALAQVDAVPAGRYARAALDTLGLWETLSPQVVQGANVRAALRFVERGEAAFGIGYASDLVALPALVGIYEFPDETHPPIQYFGGHVSPSGIGFMDYVQGQSGQSVLARWGFSLLVAQ